MIFQYLPRVTAKTAVPLTKEKFYELIRSAQVETNVRLARQALAEGNKDAYIKAKALLPAVMWVGVAPELKTCIIKGSDPLMNQKDGLPREASKLVPTQLYMVDIDHIEKLPEGKSVKEFFSEMLTDETISKYQIVMAHVTPSGKGLRIIAQATQPFPTLKEHMDWLVNELKLYEFGDYDSACKDFSRLSFLVPESDFLVLPPDAESGIIKGSDPLMNQKAGAVDVFENEPKTCIIKGSDPLMNQNRNYNDDNKDTDKPSTPQKDDGPEEADYDNLRKLTYRGHPYVEIVERYVETYGVPEVGERHNYYNSMVKYFRCICNNNVRLLHAILPRFGNGFDETLKQCKFMCKQNTLRNIPKEFFFFLLDNGFYPRKDAEADEDLKAYLEDESEEQKPKMPTLPPVFKQFCDICPEDFIMPTINALMPIMGTLTSYLRAEYFDGQEQSTTFFNVVYAPPGTGKSFVSRFMTPLFALTEARDEIANMREQIYLTKKSGKSSNDKDPVDPHVSVRIMPAINSQPEFLTKMRDNKGYHMFTFAEEVDTFNKGTKAAGGDKSDLFRIAWDNGKYGQSFKSAGTFKGMVQLFYNILLTGTPQQVRNYYRNVENGMATRVSLCEIENQQFAARPRWKKLNAIQKSVIDAFVRRCDENTYMEPLDFSVDDALAYDGDEFDKEVPWKYTYRQHQHVDMEWLFPALDEWLEEKRKEASLAEDYALDTWRRRVAVKGFRLALLSMATWKKVTKKEQKIIQDFVIWWMNYDLEQSMKFFREEYNRQQSEATVIAKEHKSLFSLLLEEFGKSDVVAMAMRIGVKSKAKQIIHRWVKQGVAVKIEGNKWKKML